MSFETYVKEDINLFGLWVQIFPTLDVDANFKKEWQRNLKNMLEKYDDSIDH